MCDVQIMIGKCSLENDTVQIPWMNGNTLWVLFWNTQDLPGKWNEFASNTQSIIVNYKQQKWKAKMIVPKLWLSNNSQIGALKHQNNKQQKMLGAQGFKAVENFKTNKESTRLKSQSKKYGETCTAA